MKGAMRTEREHKTMVDNSNDIFVTWPSAGDLQFAFHEGARRAAHTVSPKRERRPEDEPTIEMTQAELEELWRQSGLKNQIAAEAGSQR